MRETLQAELDRLERKLRREAVLSVTLLDDAMKALREDDIALADQVIERDEEVDRIYVEVEQGIEALLARQTPVAIDLRTVLAMLHVNVHLERMADYCVTIAKLTKLTEELESDEALVAGFSEMAEQAARMIDIAIGAFVRRDVSQAESLVELDETIDSANRRVAHRVLALGGDEAMREWGLRMLLVSRCLERIGDHAVDIGEQVAYLVTGEFREFTDASR